MDKPEWTGERIYRLHTSGGGSLNWKQVVAHTGLTLGRCRGRVKAFLEKERVEMPAEDINTSTFEQTGPNTARASATWEGDRVVTLNDLLKACQVDLKVWQIRKWGSKAWEGYAKKEDTHLEYAAGRANGTIDRGGIETATLWSVWADFVRREPIAVYPVIHPVECPVTFRRPKIPKCQGVVRALFIGDWQMGYRRSLSDAALIPFHDRRVIDLALQVAIAAEVDEVHLGGDILDMTEWTDKYAREPAFYQTTQPAFYELHWHLRRFREGLPKARIVWDEGNHEERLRRMVIAHLPMAYELKGVDIDAPVLSLPHLLALDRLGVEWDGNYPDQLMWLNREFAVCHGDIARGSPGATAKAHVDGRRAKLIFFHIHRQEWVTMTWDARDGKVVAYAFCPGCACHIDGRVPGSKSDDNWQEGFAIGEYERGGTLASIHAIPVEEGRLVWNGRVFEARDTLSVLRRDLPDWNWGD